jgi:predicted MFS family arabinose efflux permease
VIAARTAGAGIPDRFGARTTLAAAAPAAAAGLLAVALASGAVAVLAGVVVLAAGQALAVPALGLLALAGVPPAQHGAAAGMFFAWFDAGVGLGGPAAGLAAHLGGPAGALAMAATVVVLTVPTALVETGRSDAEPLVN